MANIGGLSTGMINLIVFLVILGAGFMAAMGWGFARLFNRGGMDNINAHEPGQDQLNYMRQVRYRTRLGMFVAGQDAMKASRYSRATEEGSTV
jgi:hypothetical protein